MISWIRYLFVAVGSFTAALVLAAPSVDTYPHDPEFGQGPGLTSDIAVSGAGAVIAALTALWLRHRTGAVVASLVGAVLVGVVALAGAWRWDMYLSAAGAGVLFGTLVVFCLDAPCRALHTVIAGSVVAAVSTADPIAEYRQFASASPGTAVYVEAAVQPANAVWLVLAVISVAAAAAILLLGVDRAEVLDEPPGTLRELLVGLGLPVAAVALSWSLREAVWSLDSETGGNGRWWWGMVLGPLVIGAALWLRGSQGRVLLAAFAAAVAIGTAPSWIPSGWPSVALPVLLAAGGAWLGLRVAKPVAGVGVLALVTASAIFAASPWDNVHFAATLMLLPAAAGYAIAAALPSTAAVTAASLLFPAVMTLPLVAQFGWTSYTPLTADAAEWAPQPWTAVAVAISVAAVLAAGAAMAWIRDRRIGHEGRS
ncbi:hypothetical protein [Rhodococcus chondri]|uniref:Uncharacterized protein n=1 Tax=Rhodococcus chondri TaxID=3065941 RepID=A0ABU7JYB5_9NOCA|nr:hypothetical protein [Rhodococcus sp. CC-R104]MEE2034999.1 hypothetical protein [Rhodococcus sp. CC-R104]